MNTRDALQQLHSSDSQHNRKMHSRHGASYVNLNKRQKNLGSNPLLAADLWQSGSTHIEKATARKKACP